MTIRPPAWRVVLLGLAIIPVIGLIMAISSHLGWWPGQLAQHWAGHLTVLSLPFWAWQGRRPAIGLSMAALAAVALWPAWSAAWAPRAEAPTSASVRVMSANLYYVVPHTDSLPVIDGDLVALIETSPEDRERLRDDPRWPYQRWIIPTGFGGTALLSRYPMKAKELDLLEAPGVDAQVEMPWGRLRVIAVHTWSPSNRNSTGRNLRQLKELAGIAETEPGPLLILGDLNATPGHPGIAGLRAAGMLPPHGSEPATWPSWLGPCGITIDHAMVRGLRLGEVSPVALPGSDHHGIRLRLSP